MDTFGRNSVRYEKKIKKVMQDEKKKAKFRLCKNAGGLLIIIVGRPNLCQEQCNVDNIRALKACLVMITGQMLIPFVKCVVDNYAIRFVCFSVNKGAVFTISSNGTVDEN